MPKLRFFVATLLMALVGLLHAAKNESIDITVNGQKRNMICYTPNVIQQNMPLMIVTHGMNQNPEYQMENDNWSTLVDTEKFVLCYLRSDGNMWDTGGTKDQNFVLQTIDEMAKRYGINRNRVYWTGFSMGSMLIYHCMANVLDKIAAFAPCSGIQFSESPWNNCKKPVNLIHCHSKNDDVFPIDQYKPRDYAYHFVDVDGCTTYKKTTNYMPAGGWDNGDKELWTGGKNGSEVEIFMCNGGGHWPTRNYIKEIWSFVSRFSLQTPLQSYESTYKQAADMVDFYAEDVNIFTSLRLNHTNLKNGLTTYGPENVDQTDEAALKAATTKLQSLMDKLTTTATNNKNSSKKVTLTEFDPNLHIYLCFGQSNMEGNATPELKDYYGCSQRFLTMSAVPMSTHNRAKGSWYIARPPLCRDNTGLTPADYFGKTLIQQLPDSIKVGVINVSLGGCSIDMFNEDGLAAHIAQQADWLKGYAAAYNNNPYRTLIDLAKKAQEVGVIKGILLHQGETNNCQTDWPQKVKVIYQRMLKELNLNQDEVPLLIGEMLQQNEGGVCYGHNNIIANTPNVIANSYVVSSKNCPGASDGLHFTAEGYRRIGANYANVMMKSLERSVKSNDYSIGSLDAQDEVFAMSASSTRPLYIILTDKEGKKHDVTISCTFECSNPQLISIRGLNAYSTTEEGDATIKATFVNKDGEEISTEFQASVRMFPLTTGSFDPSLILKGTFTANVTGGTLKSQKGGMGGWHYNEGIDLSDYKYLVTELRSNSLAKPSLRIYDENDLESTNYYSTDQAKVTIVDLQNMTDASGRKVDPSHIYVVGFAVQGNSTVNIGNVYVSNADDPTGLLPIVPQQDDCWYDLSGRRVTRLQKGIYVKNGKKVMR